MRGTARNGQVLEARAEDYAEVVQALLLDLLTVFNAAHQFRDTCEVMPRATAARLHLGPAPQNLTRLDAQRDIYLTVELHFFSFYYSAHFRGMSFGVRRISTVLEGGCRIHRG